MLEVRDLRVHFPVERGWLGQPRHWVRAVDGVSFAVRSAETVGLVGESGCGKTTVGRAVVRLVEPTAGRILFEGRETVGFRGGEMRAYRRQVQMIFQDPYASLDPRMTVADIVGEGLDIHGLAPERGARARRVAGLLEAVGLDPALGQRYPHEFSGGQRQRGLAVEPKLIVCDEPVSALDVSVQAQVINLMQDLQRERGMAYLFIAHDLALVEHVSCQLLVMYLGRLVEAGPTRAVCGGPRHPYTRALLSAVPVVDPESKRQRLVLAGEVPSPIHPPPGCAFHPRCPWAEGRCRVEAPAMRELVAGHWAACHLA